MKLLSGWTLGALLAVLGVNANAADLLVKGTIVPSSCTLSLHNGGVVDFGKIRAADLGLNAYTALQPRGVPYTVNCDGGTRVGVKALDNRSSSKVPGILQSALGPDYSDVYNYGLGTTVDGRRIGGYALSVKDSVADFPLVNTIVSTNNGLNWNRGNGALGQYQNILSWSGFTATHPASVQRVSGTLEVKAVINRVSELDVTQDIYLDGLATLELRYL
ncbi:DUF1120 domain-containing protein [Pseudomonas gingeri]|uniref:DUF1120 domain-containing protein n=1 Tax=Pseudomonas gingeri TaxID=117681 RepID=A0A7Y8C1P9_9PSED|nr:DUF1120 domain-containing protein [Pseudomonas gingeri]NWA27229.1 DUF1120 domain-containing protein [Pseudomonas gingeri]NWB96213.1 DUF1120 domain-containing protein [Pseudomonas gingeri]NWD73879.1 DUF1120 domain-containing protein [Pseudomonas gingeri]